MESLGPAIVPSPGPTRPMASMPGTGLRTGPVWAFRQRPGSVRIAEGFDVEPGTVWEFAVFPDLEHDSTSDTSPDPNFGGCHLGVQFVVNGVVHTLHDQHGHPIDGTRQCLVADNWNLLRLDLSPLAGEHVSEVRLLSPDGQNGWGWFQTLGAAPTPAEEPDVVDRVRTTRGTHSAFLYSRGNALPLTCLPQGFNFLVPLTEARDRNWLYGYHRDGGPRPKLQALAFCHQPSPWIADRSAFQVMAWQTERPSVTPMRRAREFDHGDECDRPHYYRVRLEGGITCEMTPTSRAGVFSFSWDDHETRHGVILDQPFLGTMSTEELPDGRLAFRAAIAPQEGWSAGSHRPQPPAYVYGETSAPVKVLRAWETRSPLDGITIRGRRLSNSWFGRNVRLPMPRPQAAILETEAPTLELRAAMSFIGVDQARENLRREVGDASFDDIAGRGQQTWRELLGRLEIDGGTLDDRTNAWSNLAALYSWPNDHHEWLVDDTRPEGRWGYASPFRRGGLHTPSHTGCELVDGMLSVNNGYWDTFRTCWPLYSLLTPEKAPELLTGILQQYRDGGWMARWSAPGYVDCMPGTSSDAVFADASIQGTFACLRDELDAYDSALFNATRPSDDVLTGRKGIGRARFVGYVDTDTEEGLAWTMDNANCDAGIGLWSARLAARSFPEPVEGSAEAELLARHDEFSANAVWFANRALAHQLCLDTRTGFYLGRKPDGSWRVDPKNFDPAQWGHDYTETSAWGQRFHAPHDGAGLAALLGGEDALAAAIDEMQTTPAVTRPSMYGTYTYNTQEMNEAQAAGLGQLAISNQPVHHIPFMYLHAGQPWKTQWLTRELLDKQFVGSEIGQGYPGDEDNGEMSGYWLCLAMGLFPLFVGGGEWAITSPLFERFAFTRSNGTRLEVRANGVEHRYIQSLRVNGKPWDAVTIPVAVMQGDCLLEFELGPEPSDWGRGTRPFSASRTPGGSLRSWQGDRSRDAKLVGHPCLVDDRGKRSVELAPEEVVELHWREEFTPSFLTLTTPEAAAPALRVEVQSDGCWVPTDVVPKAPQHPDQTRAYLLPPAPITGLRLRATAATHLSQVEVY